MRCGLCGGVVIEIEGEKVCRSCGCVHGYSKVASPATRTLVEPCHKNRDRRSLSFNLLLMRRTDGKDGEGFIRRAREIIGRLCDNLGLNKTVEESANRTFLYLVRRAMPDDGSGPKTFSKSVQALAGYSVLVSCRRLGVKRVGWREVQRIMSKLGLEFRLSYIAPYVTRLKSSLGHLGIDRGAFNIISLVETEARVYASRVTEYLVSNKHLGLTNARRYNRMLVDRVYELLDGLSHDISGFSPKTISATLVYFAQLDLAKKCLEDPNFPSLTQREFSKVTGVSIYTLREQLTKLRRMLMKKGLVGTR